MQGKLTKVRKTIIGCFILLLLATMFVGGAPQRVNAVTKKTSTSKYPYLIKVNKKMNTVTIYKKNSKGKYTVPVKAMICSTGSNTPVGNFRTKNKYRWKWLYGNVYGQYSTRITGHILFHSVYYTKKNPASLSVSAFNKLGTSASMGCVRLQVMDAKWIYNNCGLGTTVVIYNSNNPGPLGKPAAIKIRNNIKWDPTDTSNKSNPFNKKKPVISGVKNITIAYGSTYNPKTGLKAVDTCGNIITKQVQISGKVDTQVAGTYSITYSVTDLLKRKAKKTIKVTVEPAIGMPTITGVKDRVFNYNTYKDKELGTYVLEGVSASVNGQKLADNYLTYSYTVTTDSSSILQYQVIYNVTNGSYIAQKQAIITLDKLAPTITGVDDCEMTNIQLSGLKAQLERKEYIGVTIQDNFSPKDRLTITTTLKLVADNKYELMYTVVDEAGYTTTAKANIQIVSEPEE